jgi:uncharacterized protein (DUF1810 family)
MSQLAKFLEVQKNYYEAALKEIKQGKKESDWMPYIYPQIGGLSSNSQNNISDIKDIEEGKSYLENETLKERLINVTQALLELQDVNIKDVMGDDDMKLKSSITLFKKVEETFNINCEKVFQKALDKFFNGEEDKETIDILEKQKSEQTNNNMINNFDLTVKEQSEEKENDANIFNIDNDIHKKEEQIEPIIKENKENKNNDDEMQIIEQNDDEMKIVEQNDDEMKIEEQNDDEMKIEEQNDDEMKIVEENVVLDDGKKEENESKKDNDNNNNSEKTKEKEENDMVIKEENINLLNERGSSVGIPQNVDLKRNKTNAVNSNVKKKKSIHFSLPSRSQMRNKINSIKNKGEIEMLINDKKLIDKDTIMVNPFDEDSEKKCCPDCNIF